MTCIYLTDVAVGDIIIVQGCFSTTTLLVDKQQRDDSVKITTLSVRLYFDFPVVRTNLMVSTTPFDYVEHHQKFTELSTMTNDSIQRYLPSLISSDP